MLRGLKVETYDLKMMDAWTTAVAILEYSVLALLLALSVWSIAIMLDRRKALAEAGAGESVAKALDWIRSGDTASLRAWAGQDSSIHAGALKAAIESGAVGGTQMGENLDRAVKSYLTRERLRLEKGLSVLATLGANAPFIGLFGTVLGIIRAFAALSGGGASAGASSVMSGISQALYATAAGLFVAIPAVVAFNVLSQKLRTLLSESDALKDAYAARAGQS